MALPPPIFIETSTALAELVQQLQREPLLAVDTESNNMYAYREQVCLLQVSSRTADYIIDPLKVDNMHPFGDLLADDSIEKVFHAAEFDVMSLKRDFDFTFRNIFDTMIAARIIGYESFGLGSLLEGQFGVESDKSHQRDDWGKRPLSLESLRYAQKDTHYLPPLRDILLTQLDDVGRLAEARESFNDLCRVAAAPVRDFDPEGYWRLGRPRMLNRREMKILRELYILRDELARKNDIPPHRVMTNNTLVHLAEQAPRTSHDLKRIRGMRGGKIRRYGRRVLEAIQKGEKARHLPEPPRRTRPDPIIMERYAALHLWRKERAIERGVDSDVIVTKQTLWDLAHKAPPTLHDMQSIRGLGPWRLETYGAEILDVLQQVKTLEG